MKIAFISGNLTNGGAQRVISVVASELAERGHDVSLLLFCRGEEEYPLSDKVKVAAIRDSWEEYEKVSGLERILLIRKYLKKLQPQAAIGFIEGGYALWLSSFGMNLKKVASVRTNPQVLFDMKGLRAILNKLWFRSADAVVVQTSRQLEMCKEMRWKKRVIIANPVSDAALAVPSHDYTRPCQRIVMAGRLVEQKNYPMAITAMAQVCKTHPEVKMDIFGQGLLEEELQAQITELGLQDNVFLRGWTRDVLAEHAAGDLYVMSSDYEGMPNALMEAMAAGLPCISTDCPTGPEDLIADGENGYLVPVEDADALAQRILEVVEMSADQRRELGENARQTLAEQFNSRAIAGRWEAMLEQLIDT